jgi:hypothetical protein
MRMAASERAFFGGGDGAGGGAGGGGGDESFPAGGSDAGFSGEGEGEGEEEEVVDVPLDTNTQLQLIFQYYCRFGRTAGEETDTMGGSHRARGLRGGAVVLPCSHLGVRGGAHAQTM